MVALIFYLVCHGLMNDSSSKYFPKNALLIILLFINRQTYGSARGDDLSLTANLINYHKNLKIHLIEKSLLTHIQRTSLLVRFDAMKDTIVGLSAFFCHNLQRYKLNHLNISLPF